MTRRQRGARFSVQRRHSCRRPRQECRGGTQECVLHTPRQGNALMEAALWLPFIFLLLFGMVELARIAYTYQTLHKVLYTVARYLGSQQGVNYCATSDVDIVQQAKLFALTGNTDESAESFIANLTPDMIGVRFERVGVDGSIAAYTDDGVCAQPPDFIVVSIPDGYQIQLRIPFITLDPVPLKPQIRLPFGGT